MDKMKKILKTMFKIILIAHLIFMGVIFFVLLYLTKNNPSITSLMLYRTHVSGYTVKPVSFVPLSCIPDDLQKMAIATEDYRFYTHYGIDLEAIKRAYFINKKFGYRMYGGSTITQQLSRSLFLVPRKLFVRKYLELIISLEMDMVLSKSRILELYLNYCEWGRGVFGIAAGARSHYNKHISCLTLDETARLITILANPVDYTPYTFENRRFLANRYYIIKFRHYTFTKFQAESKSQPGVLTSFLR